MAGFPLLETIICDNSLSLTLQLHYLVNLLLTNTTANLSTIVLILSFINPYNFYKIFFLKFSLSFWEFSVYNNKLILESLLVGYNSVHPLLLYTGFSFLIILYMCAYITYINLRIASVIVTVALSLGSFWGLGNSIWGFFWVNDSIELILLNLLLLILINIHTELRDSINNICFVLLLLFVLNIVSLRLGVSFTRHNFFDNKTINNLFIVYPIGFKIFLLKTLMLPCGGFSIYILTYLILIYLRCYKLQKLQKLHTLFFLFFYCWLKYKTNNNSYYLTFVNYFNFVFQTDNLILADSLNTLYSKKLFLLCISFFNVYPLKFLGSLWVINSYVITFNTILLILLYTLIIVN